MKSKKSFRCIRSKYCAPTIAKLNCYSLLVCCKVYWNEGRICTAPKPLAEVRDRVQSSLKTLRQDIKRSLNPTPYKVAVSDNLYNFIHDLWLQNAPIGELF
ncbi:unnamed protein product [Euphydryas editha]|uniref:nicotinate phosphoribosyltransferase n=1 Tax=Euphydryas editha TaxID=104508 RepID=A0AAU9URZ6_EUPED|nr:unnamed protein product [Euphydryas editha]